jgi:hypothetical protein
VEEGIIHSSREISCVAYVFLGGEDEGAVEESVDVDVVLSPGSLFVRVRRAAWSNQVTRTKFIDFM